MASVYSLVDDPVRRAVQERRTKAEQLKRQITELTAHVDAAMYRLLQLIAELDRIDGWCGEGVRSHAHWLNFRCAVGLHEAHERVRTAKALEHLPKLSAAMARGSLSYCNAKAITRVATPDNEEYFLNIAHHGSASHVAKLARKYRSVLPKEPPDPWKRAEEHYLHYHHDEDGGFNLRGRLPAEDGARILKALDAAMDRLFKAHRESYPKTNAEREEWGRQPQGRSLGLRRADALVLMADTVLENGPQSGNGGDRYQVVVHVDAQTLLDSTRPGRCEVENGPTLTAATLKRLGCDASVVSVIEDSDGNALNVGRRTRSIPPALRRALKSRDEGCRFPGCTHERFVDGHHIEHWAHGGETSLANLVQVCRFHHRLLHEEGFCVDRDADGELVFTDPHGRRLQRGPPVEVEGGAEAIKAMNRAHGLDIDEKTAVPKWYAGDEMDYYMAVDALLQIDKKAARDGPS